MSMQRLNPDGLHAPIACYSQVVRRGAIIAVSGMASIDETGSVVGPGEIAVQIEQTIKNLSRALHGAGATLEDVAKVTIYLSDFAHYRAVDEVYRKYFGRFPPARATVRADLVYPDLLVEIEAWAILSDS